jgi:hypothetical protein
MDGNSFRNLVEAYSKVYTQVDENLLGSLDKTARDTAGKVGGVLGREKAGKMPGANVPILGDVIKNEGERRGRAQGQGMYDKAKETIGGLLKQDYEYDTFDIILEYLVAEGYADTNQAAIAIMANMSEEWRQSIVEMGQTRTTGQNSSVVRTTPGAGSAGGSGSGGRRGSGLDRNATQTSSSPGALRIKKQKTPSPTSPTKQGRTFQDGSRPSTTPTKQTSTQTPEKPKTKSPATPAPTPPPTASQKPTEPSKAETPKPSGGEVAGSKIGDKSDYSVAATAKMSDRTKTILGTKDSETGKTIRKAQFGSLSARERQGLG